MQGLFFHLIGLSALWEAYLSNTHTYTKSRTVYIIIVCPHIKYVVRITYLAFVILSEKFPPLGRPGFRQPLTTPLRV